MMPSEPPAYRFPYATTPGTSTQEPHVTPKEGIHDLWVFFWLALLNTAIIVVAGVAAWYYLH
jgi:hypothetical protein